MGNDIRGAFSKDKELGELKRDLDSALKKVPPFQFKELTAPYTEPMYLGLKSKPIGVLLLSCVDIADQEDADSVLAGAFCHGTWEGAKSRLRINSVDGLTPDPTVYFKFTFLVVG